MWIVRVALDRPCTFVVPVLLILLMSPVIIQRTPTGIFPNINIPVIAVAWQYTGLNPEEIEGRITSAFERTLTTTVDNIEHIEWTTLLAGDQRPAYCTQHGGPSTDGHSRKTLRLQASRNTQDAQEGLSCPILRQ